MSAAQQFEAFHEAADADVLSAVSPLLNNYLGQLTTQLRIVGTTWQDCNVYAKQYLPDHWSPTSLTSMQIVPRSFDQDAGPTGYTVRAQTSIFPARSFKCIEANYDSDWQPTGNGLIIVNEDNWPHTYAFSNEDGLYTVNNGETLRTDDISRIRRAGDFAMRQAEAAAIDFNEFYSR